MGKTIDSDYYWIQEWMLQTNWNKEKYFWTTNSFQALKSENTAFATFPWALDIFLLKVIIRAQKLYVEIEFKLGSFSFKGLMVSVLTFTVAKALW